MNPKLVHAGHGDGGEHRCAQVGITALRWSHRATDADGPMDKLGMSRHKQVKRAEMGTGA